MARSQKVERELLSFDYGLRRVLRRKTHYEVLEGFLSELLHTDVSIKSIDVGEAIYRYNGMDILVEDETGELLLIELQFMVEFDFIFRMLHGTKKPIAERMVQVPEYSGVKKVYSIYVLFYFDLGRGEDYIYHGNSHLIGLHKNDELCLPEAKRAAIGEAVVGDICPEYYILKVHNFDDNVKDRLDEWMYFLKHNMIKLEFKAKGLKRARKILVLYKFPPEEQKRYEYMLDQRSRDVSDIESAKLEGIEIGKEIGREIGIKKGIEEIREKRREEERIKREKLVEEFEKEREIFLAEIARLKQNK
jgi:hypothetical protein